MKILILAITPLLFSYVNAEDLNFNTTKLNDIKAIQVDKLEIEIPIPTKKLIAQENHDYISGEIKEFHLLAQTAKKLIYTHADTEKKFKDFLTKWTPILNKAGLKPTKTEYKHTLGFQHYDSDEGYVLRDFWADKLNYDALASSEIYKLQHELITSLKKNNMPTIAAFRINNDYVRPTFKLYYRTKYNENPDHEIRLRLLKKGNDIDYAILEKAGVNIIRKDRTFSMVYIGKELGFVTRFGKSAEAIKIKIEEYKKFLKENDKEFLGSKIIEFDEPVYEYTHAVNLYFYQ
ncbi:MAG: hypothetical protein KAI33_05050 [Elusimicrobiales bacterium]|nr:hypothetical protein [Elusimicrobiales bacterium]